MESLRASASSCSTAGGNGAPGGRNSTPKTPSHGGWAFVEGPAEEDSHNAFVYRPGTFRRRWASPRQVEVNIYPYKGWCNCIVPVASIDEASRTIRLAG